jgi:hypothetical protein
MEEDANTTVTGKRLTSFGGVVVGPHSRYSYTVPVRSGSILPGELQYVRSTVAVAGFDYGAATLVRLARTQVGRTYSILLFGYARGLYRWESQPPLSIHYGGRYNNNALPKLQDTKHEYTVCLTNNILR